MPNEHQKHWQRLDSEDRLILIAPKCDLAWVLAQAGAIAAQDVGLELEHEEQQ